MGKAHPLSARQFRTLFQQGRHWRETHVSLWVREATSRTEPTRWGIVVGGKTVRGAVKRNRWKRRIREVLRYHLPLVHPGFEGLIRLERLGEGLLYRELRDEMGRLLKLSGVT